MFTCMWVLGIVLFSAAAPGSPQPTPEPLNFTSCEDFEWSARFDPYSVVDSMWKIFYFWSNTTEVYPIIFSLPARKRLLKFKEVIDSIQPHIGIEWERSTLLMAPRPGIEVLFLYQGTPGAFRAVIKYEQRDKARPNPEPILKFADIRMKLVERVMGMMCCEDLTAFALIRMTEMPITQERCEEAAATIGYHGHQGRCYLEIMKPKNEDEL